MTPQPPPSEVNPNALSGDPTSTTHLAAEPAVRDERRPAFGLSIADRLSLPRLHWGWLLLLIGLAALGWASRSVAGPFIAGFILAYLLNPPVSRLQSLKMGKFFFGRGLASALVLLVFAAALIGLLLAIAPIVTNQVALLTERLPALIESIVPFFNRWVAQAPGSIDLQILVDKISERALGWLSNSVGPILAGSLGFFNVLNFVIVTPVVAYYLIRDWPNIVAAVESWLPRRQLPAFKNVLRDSDIALSGFVRGQSMVCVVLAVFYTIGWSLVGLNYSIVLGILAGILGFVPFLGVILAVVLSLVVALGQFGLDWIQLLLVFGVFQVGQILESAILTPNLIGDRIGLHPVWVLFAVFAGGAVAGLAGVFLAVPVAAVLGVVVRAMFDNYRRSNFYGLGQCDDSTSE